MTQTVRLGERGTVQGTGRITKVWVRYTVCILNTEAIYFHRPEIVHQ